MEQNKGTVASWTRHFMDVASGKATRDRRLYRVQTGDGPLIKTVSPVSQTVDMARATIKRANESDAFSTPKRRRTVNKSRRKPKTKKTKKTKKPKAKKPKAKKPKTKKTKKRRKDIFSER